MRLLDEALDDDLAALVVRVDSPGGTVTGSEAIRRAILRHKAKGIPVAFFTTGLHPDYHRPSEGVDRIRFDKMARVAQLVYQSAFAVAQSEATLIRDNKGPRTGFGTGAQVISR